MEKNPIERVLLKWEHPDLRLISNRNVQTFYLRFNYLSVLLPNSMYVDDTYTYGEMKIEI